MHEGAAGGLRHAKPFGPIGFRFGTYARAQDITIIEQTLYLFDAVQNFDQASVMVVE